MAACALEHPYAEFIHSVEKPARYLGGEYQSVRKDWDAVACRVVLAFPDLYDVGMSHLGTKILYSLLNRHPSILCERAFTPWTDMEAELRRRGLPLLTLESARPLADFDVVGISLQYELTYTNCLTLLDLGGIPLRAADRSDADPLVLGGGPTATHPEPVAPFFDAFFIGEAEEVLPDLLLSFAAMKRAGLPRRERLVRLAERGCVYVPELYRTRTCARSGLVVVDSPLDARVPARVRRTWVRDLNQFPFPTDSPVPYAEAIFDRASVEIARGCTEGCRFCQAGMIYRPVRERDPDSIVQSIVEGVRRGGYDETSLTSLSTADYSCIVPLVKRVMSRLREEKVALSVSSLRAYGLQPDLLDEMASVRATGLTFAPEAGTQRMRDVINKNITEEDITRSAENVFSRGWSRMKLYFMIGLPTETDEDVAGIIKTAGRLRRLGKRIRPDAEITVSVSSHVPKPHTPFQWCAMDSLEEIRRKQHLLRELAQHEHVALKWHEARISFLEGVLARGDRRLANVIERAWRAGARFDGWDEQFDLDVWLEALAAEGVDPAWYLGTLPVDGGLPWDHIDIGLEDGFLLGEYRKALKDRLSPPCGKPFGSLLHHTNVEDALADGRRLVCYDCGIACDLSQMRSQRLSYLRQLGAERPDPEPPAVARPPSRPRPAFQQGMGYRYRIRYTKLGRTSFLSHLDTMRLLQRLIRRAGIEMIYTQGFHPKPVMSLGPALGLGVASLGELCEVRLAFPQGMALPAEALRDRLQAVAPDGLVVDQVVLVPEGAPALSRCIALADLAIGIPVESGVDLSRLLDPTGADLNFLNLKIERVRQGERRTIDLGQFLQQAHLLEEAEAAAVREQLGWPTSLAVLRARVRASAEGSARPAEVAAALLRRDPPPGTRYARLQILGPGGTDPCDPTLFVPTRRRSDEEGEWLTARKASG
ncbi:MAG: TIGR03960 family B12-binding radical SAM protein [Myxococcales bacterium]|nr:TIGR03960 family B12-binding radical SAM protein [Myxococcota bacterium]MDW8281514.1 TIGR03960 family B12-binding radical SAM protein [Myxococcales bacterium]